MLRAHKIALNPNKTQATFFSSHCGYARVAYNAALADFKAGLSAGEWHSQMTLRRRFNKIKFQKYEWCKSHSQNAAKNAIINLGDAIRRWHKGQNEFPKFKRKGGKKSYQADNGKGTVKLQGKRLYLPKIGWIKMFEFLKFKGVITRVVISKTAHRWFASILVKSPDNTKTEKPDVSGFPIIGVDVGIKHQAIISDGRSFENPKALDRYGRKLARLHRGLSRKQFLSKNWYKQKMQIARLYYRISCIREDVQHKASTAIVRSASKIGIESLNVNGMLKNHRLAKALSDAALSDFLTMLKYKAEHRGVEIVEAERWFPSSKICSACGAVKKNLSLADRVYTCNCGLTIDRDLNAAINLKKVAVSCTETFKTPVERM